MSTKFFEQKLITGLGKAAEVAMSDMQMDHDHVQKLRNKFNSGLSSIERLHLNGHETQNYPGILNYSFEFIEGEALMMAIKNVAVSSGSACTSASLEPSYVLRGLGVGEDLAHTSIRFSFGFMFMLIQTFKIMIYSFIYLFIL